MLFVKKYVFVVRIVRNT